MKISIVTISYNQGKFLRSCIESVLSERDKLAEIGVKLNHIIVDPGSTDGSRELIESYDDKVVKLFEKDNGPADGLNKGFSKADGDILGYLNSDDILLSGSLVKVAKFFKKHSKSTDVICGAANLIGPNNEVYRVLYSDRYSPLAYAYSGCVMIQPSSFFKRDIYLKTNGFNENNKTNWDGELFVDMAQQGAKFKTITDVLSGYRVHDESITGTMSTAEKMKEYRSRMYTKITGNNISSYSKITEKYFKYSRKIKNWRDTLERIKNGRSFGRAL